jgi:hypothetical protein
MNIRRQLQDLADSGDAAVFLIPSGESVLVVALLGHGPEHDALVAAYQAMADQKNAEVKKLRKAS